MRNHRQQTKKMFPAGELEKLRTRLEDSIVLVEEITEFTSGLMGDLRPPDMDLLGLVASIGWYGERFSIVIPCHRSGRV